MKAKPRSVSGAAKCEYVNCSINEKLVSEINKS